jgi:hypothetical protein
MTHLSRRSKRLARAQAKAQPQARDRNETPHAAPEPTAFELAWQEALDRSNQKKSGKPSQAKAVSKEQAEIIDRTMEKRIPTSN